MTNYFIFFSFIIFITLSILGYGIICKKLLINNNIIKKINIGETGIIGFFLLYLFSVIFHFFFPLYVELNLFILLLGFLFFLFYFRNILTNINYSIILIVFFLLIFGLFNLYNHPDFDWYYLPYVNYLNNYKIIFGIATINDFLAYSHSWIDILAVFSLPYIGVKGLNVISIIFVVFCIFSLIEYFKITKNYLIKFTIFFILIFCISNYTKTSEYGGDIPSILLGFITLIFFLKITLTKKNNRDLLIKFIFFYFFLLLLRVNYIIFLPAVIYLYFLNFKIINSIFFKKGLVLFFIIVSSFYFTKNFIHSGCALYPIPYTCVNSNLASWSLGKELSSERYNLLSASSKGWKQHLSIEANLENRYEYFNSESSKLLLPHEYISKSRFYWVKYWMKDGDIIKNLNSFLIIVFAWIILFFFSDFKKFRIKKFCKLLISKKNILSILLLILLLWFLLSPQSRYGGDNSIVFISSFIFAILSSALFFKKGRLKLGMAFVLILSLAYFEYKNISKFYVEYFKHNPNYPFSETNDFVNEKDYYKISKNGIYFNLKKNEHNKTIGMPTWCGNIKMLCLPEDRFQCISKVEKKSYLFILPNRKKCLNHLKDRLWY